MINNISDFLSDLLYLIKIFWLIFKVRCRVNQVKININKYRQLAGAIRKLHRIIKEVSHSGYSLPPQWIITLEKIKLDMINIESENNFYAFISAEKQKKCLDIIHTYCIFLQSGLLDFPKKNLLNKEIPEKNWQRKSKINQEEGIADVNILLGDITKLLEPLSYKVQDEIIYLLRSFTISNGTILYRRSQKLHSGAWVTKDRSGNHIFYTRPVKGIISILTIGNRYTRQKDFLTVEKKMNRLKALQ
jgi:hypothetical protein